MKTNRVARRILGLPYKLSRSKNKVSFSIVPSTEASNLPSALKNASFVCLMQDNQNSTDKKQRYLKVTAAYPEYLINGS